jgi:thymidylate kinase
MTVSPSKRERLPLNALIASAFSAFDDQGIRWCLLRGEDDLEVPGGDVDVLVASEDLGRVRAALASLGFVRLPAWGHGSHAFFVAYQPGGDRWVWLDLVSDVRFGGYQSIRVAVESELLSRRERLDGVAVLAPGDAFWMLALHCLLDKDAVPLKHRARLEQLAAQAKEATLAGFFEAASPSGWTVERLVESIEAGDWAAVDALGRRLRHDLGGSLRSRAVLRSLANRVLRVLGKFQRVVSTRGLIVVLLASDGAGKSTLAEGLRRSFPTYDVRVVYMGLYRRGPGRIVRRLPGLFLGSRLAMAWARYLRARVHRAAGRLVVLDRYVYDVRLPSSRPVGRLDRAHAWLVSHSLPPPDLVLVLDVAGNAAFARKGEETADSLERQRLGYIELSKRLRRAHVVDASADADSVRRQAVSLIWSAGVRRLDGS